MSETTVPFAIHTGSFAFHFHLGLNLLLPLSSLWSQMSFETWLGLTLLWCKKVLFHRLALQSGENTKFDNCGWIYAADARWRVRPHHIFQLSAVKINWVLLHTACSWVSAITGTQLSRDIMASPNRNTMLIWRPVLTISAISVSAAAVMLHTSRHWLGMPSTLVSKACEELCV